MHMRYSLSRFQSRLHSRFASGFPSFSGSSALRDARGQGLVDARAGLVTDRSVTLRVAACMLGLPLLLAAGGCATKPPNSDTAAAAATGTGAQTIGPTGLRRILGSLAPYRISVQQGNFVSSEMLSQLKVGMTPDQVRFTLGTPLLTDAFHTQRWDYIFRLQRGSGEVTTSRVSVFFKDNLLSSFEGGDLPTEVDYLARITGGTPAVKDLPAVTPPTKSSSANDNR